MNTYFLNPSKLFVTSEDYEVITILGSCVAIALYDHNRHIGGMNHYMLPLWNGRDLPSPKYGNIAIERLIRKMVDYGAAKTNIVAKVFGGAEVINNDSNALFHIGKSNVEMAFKMLDQEGIKVEGNSTGFRYGRKVFFYPRTGEVLMKYVNRSKAPAVPSV